MMIDLIKQLEEGRGLGARIGKRELEYVRALWRGENTREIKVRNDDKRSEN